MNERPRNRRPGKAERGGTAASLQALRSRVSGAIMGAEDPRYDEARRVWNGMIDRHPAAVVRAASVADIAPAVRFARTNNLPLAVRGGGHSVAGNGTVDNGLVLDLGSLRSIDIDPERRLVRADAGATLRDLDTATGAHGLAVPVGVVSATGVAGLTLGGGVGWLTRAHGLTVDNLESVELVTASERVVRASRSENPELFWGLRGGGGNFGVVSSFTFRAHPLPDEVFSGNLIYGRDRWPAALRAFEEWSRDLPDALTAIISFLVPPPGWDLGDNPLLIVGFAWAGPNADEGASVVERLRAAAEPDVAVLEAVPWTAWQSAADELFPKGVRGYWKNTSFDVLDDAVIDVLVRRGAEQAWRGTGFDVHHLGGAFGRVPEDATPFPNRSARFWLNVYGFWADPADDLDRTRFVRGLAEDMAPHASGGQYMNFMGVERGPDAREQALAIYGPRKLRRLSAIKRDYDPDNVFNVNQNIPPALTVTD